MTDLQPPRRPGLTWSGLARVGGRVLAAFALVWLLALVAWPEQRREIGAMLSPEGREHWIAQGRTRDSVFGFTLRGIAERKGVSPHRCYIKYVHTEDGAWFWCYVYAREASLRALLGNLVE